MFNLPLKNLFAASLASRVSVFQGGENRLKPTKDLCKASQTWINQTICFFSKCKFRLLN